MSSGHAELGFDGKLGHAGGFSSRAFMKDLLTQWLTWEEEIAATSLVGHTRSQLLCMESKQGLFNVQFCPEWKVWLLEPHHLEDFTF